MTSRTPYGGRSNTGTDTVAVSQDILIKKRLMRANLDSKKATLWKECGKAVSEILNREECLCFNKDVKEQSNNYKSNLGTRAIVPLIPTPLCYQKDLMFLLLIEKRSDVGTESPFDDMEDDAEHFEFSEDRQQAIVAVHRRILFSYVTRFPQWLGDWDGEDSDGETEQILDLRPWWDPTTKMGSFPIFPFPVPSIPAFTHVLRFIYTGGQDLKELLKVIVPEIPDKRLPIVVASLQHQHSPEHERKGKREIDPDTFQYLSPNVRCMYFRRIQELQHTAKWCRIRSHVLWSSLSIMHELVSNGVSKDKLKSQLQDDPAESVISFTASSGRGFKESPFIQRVADRIIVRTNQRKIDIQNRRLEREREVAQQSRH